MKKPELLFASVVLIALLSASGVAGTISTWKTQPNPTPTPAAAAESDAAEGEGVMETGVVSAEAIREIALNLLESVLTLS